MKTSVIIPTFNEENVILDCLNSLDNLKGKFELIVVDDGSTDSTLTLISNFKPKNYKLTILSQSHLGAGEARNLGAKEAKGEILVFVDADMTFEPDFLDKLISPIKKQGVIGTFSKDEYVGNWDNIWARCWNWNLNLQDKRRLPEHYPDTQKVFRAISKSEFERVSGFSKGGYTDDWSLSEKLKKEAVIAKDAVFYHKNPDNLKEVFFQSRWSAKRKYKFGILGTCLSLVRLSLPWSIIIGIYKSIKYKCLLFLLFKIVYDVGAIFGIITYTIFNNGKK